MRRPGTVRRRWSLLALFVSSSVLWAEGPILERETESWFVLTGLPPVLSAGEVEPHLTKGLTTTFVFVVDLLGVSQGKQAGGARVEIRYELWDEVFHATTTDIGGKVTREVIDSIENLVTWWEGQRLRVVDLDVLSSGVGSQARVRLDVVPFSRTEQRETQEWFARSVSAAELARNEGASASVDGSSGGQDGVFSVLIATSIQRRPLTSYRWTIDLPRERSP